MSNNTSLLRNNLSVGNLDDLADRQIEEFFEDERQLISKLLQICNGKTQSIVLLHPASIAESDPDKAGFDYLETLLTLQKKHAVFTKFSPPLPKKLSHTFVTEAHIDFSKLISRAESLHDETETWKGKVYGIEQQKKYILGRLMDYIRKSPHEDGKPYEYSERILGTYAPTNDRYPLGMSLSRPDPNRIDIKYQFMRTMRELEKEGNIEILGVRFEFDAQPRATSESEEEHKWSLGERSLIFYPARHCHVTLRLKPTQPATNTPITASDLPKDVEWKLGEDKWSLVFTDGRKLEFVNIEKPTAKYFKLLIENLGSEVKHKKVKGLMDGITKEQIENLVKALRKKIHNAKLTTRVTFTTNFEGGYTLNITRK